MNYDNFQAVCHTTNPFRSLVHPMSWQILYLASCFVPCLVFFRYTYLYVFLAISQIFGQNFELCVSSLKKDADIGVRKCKGSQHQLLVLAHSKATGPFSRTLTVHRLVLVSLETPTSLHFLAKTWEMKPHNFVLNLLGSSVYCRHILRLLFQGLPSSNYWKRFPKQTSIGALEIHRGNADNLDFHFDFSYALLPFRPH